MHRKKTRKVYIKISIIKQNHGKCFKVFFFVLFVFCKFHTMNTYYFYNQKIKLRVRWNSTEKLGLHHGPKVPQKPFLPGLPGINIIMPGHHINIIIPEALSASTLDQHCLVSHKFLNLSRLCYLLYKMKGLDNKIKSVELQNLQAVSLVLFESHNSLMLEASSVLSSPFDP